MLNKELTLAISAAIKELIDDGLIYHVAIIDPDTSEVHLCTNAHCEKCAVDVITMSSKHITHTDDTLHILSKNQLN